MTVQRGGLEACLHRRIAGLVLLLAFGTATADAQERTPAQAAAPSEVRVVKDQTTIWNRNPSMVLAIVKSGTVLRAVAREDRWIEVLVPPKEGGKGNTGFVLAAHVEHVAGTPDIPLRQARHGESMWDASGEPRSGAPRAPAPMPPTVGVRGFASGSYAMFQAKDTFEAIFDSAWQPFYGGGAQVVIFDKLFVEGSFEQFKKTGERVVVSDGEVFPLGIEDRVTINPFTVSRRLPFPVAPHTGVLCGRWRGVVSPPRDLRVRGPIGERGRTAHQLSRTRRGGGRREQMGVHRLRGPVHDGAGRAWHSGRVG